jgi:hypothetical protein
VKALNQLGVRNPVVLGHSWGTLVAIAFALQMTIRSAVSCLRPVTTSRRGVWTCG